MADKLQECLEKKSKRNVADTRTDSSGGGSVGSERCKLAIFPTWSLIYQVFGMAQTSANASVLVISPLNSIVEEQAREINGLGPMRPVLWTPSSKDLDGKFQMIFASAEDC